MITEDYAHILVLLKKIRDEAEERGRCAEFLKLAKYYKMSYDIDFYADKVKNLDCFITDNQILLLKLIGALK